MTALKNRHDEERRALNEKLQSVYNERLKINNLEFETANELRQTIENLEQELMQMKNENDSLKTTANQLRMELDECANKMEANELKMITLHNENEQLHEMKMDNISESELNDTKSQNHVLQAEIDRMGRELQEERDKGENLEKRCEEMETLHNELMMKGEQMSKEQKVKQDETASLKRAYQQLLAEYNELDREFVKFKNFKKNQKKMKRVLSVLTPKHSENTMQIETKILEQELFDEQQRTKDLIRIIDELKVENSILSTDIGKLKRSGDNVDILEMQSLLIKNDKLAKKIKIQQKKIEMYKKKMGKNKNDFSILSIGSSTSCSSNESSKCKRSKKRKYSELRQLAVDTRDAKRIRHN